MRWNQATEMLGISNACRALILRNVGKRDGLRGVNDRMRSSRNLLSEEVPDTFPHCKGDSLITQGFGGLDCLLVRDKKGDTVGTLS